MIAQKTRYALRSLLFLAEEQGGNPVQLARIAETQRVPPKYLELIMLDLKKAGPVSAVCAEHGIRPETRRIFLAQDYRRRHRCSAGNASDELRLETAAGRLRAASQTGGAGAALSMDAG